MNERRTERKARFIAELAKLLAGRQAEFSVRLQMANEGARVDQDVEAWRKLRDISGMRGYPTEDEAIALLEDLL